MIYNWPKFILVFLLASLLSWLFTRLMIYFAKKFGVLDQPTGDRKIHNRPIPLLGGLGIYLAFLLSVIFLWKTEQLLDSRIEAIQIVWFLLAGLVLMINGFLDDKYNFSAKYTVWGPVIASLLVIYGGLQIGYISNPSGGVLYIDNLFSTWGAWASALPAVITFLWLMGITYTTKLLDGIDGLASSIGLIASLVIFAVSLSWDIVGSTTSLLALVLAGSIFGFLLWNWHPAKIFLGEGGSTFIGFALGVLAVISGSKIATALLVMGLPVLDIVWVITARIRQKKAFWRGDNQHLHFRLLKAGFSQKQIVFFLSAVSLAFGVISIFFTTKIKITALLFLLLFMFMVSYWLNYKIKKTYESS